jgi:hypothetical protein
MIGTAEADALIQALAKVRIRAAPSGLPQTPAVVTRRAGEAQLISTADISATVAPHGREVIVCHHDRHG